PTAGGVFNFTVKATNGAGNVTKALSINIASLPPTTTTPPTITTTTLPGGTVGTSYSQTLAATGDPTITWSVASGALPGGLSLSPTGVISGTPTAGGVFNFTVKAANGAGNDTKDLSINVTGQASIGAGVAITPVTASVQKGTTQTFSAIVWELPQTVTWSVSDNNSSGTTIDSNGVLTVAANETATTLTVTATSTLVTSIHGTATVTVTPAAPAPIGGGGGGGGGAINYTVSFNTNGGGTINSQKIASGAKVSQPADPVKDGYTFAGWYTDQKLTTKFDFTKTITGNITLYANWTSNSTKKETTPQLAPPTTTTTTPAPTLQPPTGSQNPFRDVQATDWFYGDVQYALSNNLFQGTSATAFAPNGPMTRAMFVTVLWRAAGSPSIGGNNQFKDVQANAYYATAVSWAAQNKIVLGISNSSFAPNRQVTREQMAAILYRYAQFTGSALSGTVADKQFADLNKISDYAKKPVNALVARGIVSGKPGNLFDPQGTATRAEVASMLHRYMVSA
ncbi:MAG: S-layer homology domain-containing protein, partial [Firmicutes bacterium]|nr:S-layer homology domain-containing protein [Bacillota bacterium]